MTYTIKDEKGNMICSIESTDSSMSEESNFTYKMASSLHNIQQGSWIKSQFKLFKTKLNACKGKMPEFIKLGKFTREALSKHGGFRFNFELYVSEYNEANLNDLLNDFSESITDYRVDKSAIISSVKIGRIVKDTEKNKKLFRITISIMFKYNK